MHVVIPQKIVPPAMLALIAIGSGLILLYALPIGIGSSSWLSVANQAGPVILLATCLWGSYHLVKNSPLALWTPIPWFLAASAAYFGFGPLVYYFGTAETVSFIETFYEVDEVALLRTNLLNAVGITVTAAGFLLGLQFFARGQSVRIRQFNHIEVRRLMFMFLVIGLSVEYLFAMPHYLGLLSWTLPGAIQHLSGLSKIAIILLFVLVHRGFRHYRWLLYGLIGVELITALATFSKLQIIEVIVATGLGWYLGRPNLRALVIGGIAVALLYAFVLSPFISFARVTVGPLGVGSAAEVGESVASYAGTPREDVAGFVPGVQGWWARLSYSNAQAFAIDAHDSGAAGDSVGLALYAFLPRLLFPDKPFMTPGREFTVAVLGDDMETNTAAGIFGEAYWNAGWILVVLVCLYVGVVFAGFTIFAERVIAAGRYEYLPIVMIGIRMGYRPDDWFAATYVGALANAVVLYIVLRYIVMPLIRVRRARDSRAVGLNT
jgi:hypothetical protein